jgi:hypothetical protein
MLHLVIAFVKDKDSKLTTMATTLHSIINCEPLKKISVFEGISFGHVMFKAYQYAINDNKVFARLQHVNVKDAHVGLQKKFII